MCRSATRRSPWGLVDEPAIVRVPGQPRRSPRRTANGNRPDTSGQHRLPTVDGEHDRRGRTREHDDRRTGDLDLPELMKDPLPPTTRKLAAGPCRGPDSRPPPLLEANGGGRVRGDQTAGGSPRSRTTAAR